MIIYDADVDMMEKYANNPVLKLVVDRLPSTSNIVHERLGDCVFAEADGYVHFFYHNGDGKNHNGYGGSIFRVPVRDWKGNVSMMDFAGPWSGGAYCANLVSPMWVMDCTYYLKKDVYSGRKSPMGYAGHVTLLTAVDAIKMFTHDYSIYCTWCLDNNQWPVAIDFHPYKIADGPKNPTESYDLCIEDYLIDDAYSMKPCFSPSGTSYLYRPLDQVQRMVVES